MDTVDCAVAPMSACHLLLRRPWQFDVDATHGGRSNHYSFELNHVLKQIPESAIKSEDFASVRKKTNDAATTQKPRTTLLKEGEIDMRIPTPNVAASESKVNDADPNNSHV